MKSPLTGCLAFVAVNCYKSPQINKNSSKTKTAIKLDNVEILAGPRKFYRKKKHDIKIELFIICEYINRYILGGIKKVSKMKTYLIEVFLALGVAATYGECNIVLTSY